MERRLARVVTTPPPAPGFIGHGHTAVIVLEARDFAEQDPFIALMDDRLDLAPGAEAGAAHPHAGFETVTFVLEGELHDPDEGVLRAGDVQWMTAGSGIIHGEHVVPHGFTRILQLWLALPPDRRWTAPRFETVYRDDAPVICEPGATVRVYCGGSGDAIALTHNHVPVTLADIALEPGAAITLDVPVSYNGFVLGIEGSVTVGRDEVAVGKGQAGWLERVDATGPGVLKLTGGPQGARVVLYAGEPQRAPLVTHGPFVGGTRADLVRASQDFVNGRFPRMSELLRAARPT